MFKESAEKMVGNDAFEGYAIDLISEIAQILSKYDNILEIAQILIKYDNISEIAQILSIQ